MATNDIVAAGIKEDAELKRINDGAFKAEKELAEKRRKAAEEKLAKIKAGSGADDVTGQVLRSFDSAMQRRSAQQLAVQMQTVSRQAGYGGAMPREGESTAIEWNTGRAAPAGSYAKEREFAEKQDAAAKAESTRALKMLGGAALAAGYVLNSAIKGIQDAQASGEGSAEARRIGMANNLRTLGYSEKEQDSFIAKYEGGTGKYGTGADVAKILAAAAARNRSMGPGIRVGKGEINQALTALGTNQASAEDITAGLSGWGGFGLNVPGQVYLSGGRMGALGARGAQATGNFASRSQMQDITNADLYEGSNGAQLRGDATIQQRVTQGGLTGLTQSIINEIPVLNTIDRSSNSRSDEPAYLEYQRRAALAAERTAEAQTNPLNTTKGR